MARYTFYLHRMKRAYAQIQLDHTVTTAQSQYALGVSLKAIKSQSLSIFPERQ